MGNTASKCHGKMTYERLIHIKMGLGKEL